MCSTQTMTIPDGKGGSIEVSDTQDCGKSTCVHSAHYVPPKD